MRRSTVIAGWALGAPLAAAARPRPARARAAEPPRLDFAYHNPASPALRQSGWLEEAARPRGIAE